MTLQSIEFDQPTDARLWRLALGRFAKWVLSPRCTVRRGFRQSRIAPTAINGLPCAQPAWSIVGNNLGRLERP
jgi:hypothetical protein